MEVKVIRFKLLPASSNSGQVSKTLTKALTVVIVVVYEGCQTVNKFKNIGEKFFNGFIT